MSTTTTTTCKLLYSTYHIAFDGDTITTTLTHNASIVTKWIRELKTVHRHRLHKLIIGLDVEWCPNTIPNQKPNPAAILQLCVGRKCLIFQLIYADEIPQSLRDFLTNESHTFVGVGVHADACKLQLDHDLEVSNSLDLRSLAVECLNRMDLGNAGLKSLASKVLGKEMVKPGYILWRNWDEEQLSEAQCCRTGFWDSISRFGSSCSLL